MFLAPSSDATGQARTTSLPKTVIMLTACTESGRQKSARYWPDAVGDSIEVHHQVPSGGRREFRAGSLPPVSVKWISSTPSSAKDAKAQEGWRTNKLHLSCPSFASAEINHIEYLGWQDHGVPSSPVEVLDLVKYVESIVPDPQEPIVIHCSAGVGRTGTFIAISTLLPLLQRLRAGEDLSQLFKAWQAEREASPLGPLPLVTNEPPKSKLVPSFLASSSKTPNGLTGFDPVMATVDHLRDQRTTMVQTPAQLAFIYETARAWWQHR
jgi:protein-tyrosine phosphatase